MCGADALPHFLAQVIKALSPMIVMAMSYFVLQRRYGPKLIASVIFIAIGAVMAVPFKDPSVTVLGVVLVAVATVASSLKPVVGELLMTASDKPKLAPAGAGRHAHPTTRHTPCVNACVQCALATHRHLTLPSPCARAALVFYDSCFSFFFMLTFWLSVPAEREGSITYMREKPAMGWGIILVGSFAAFAYNMSIYNFTKLASAVAVMVTTNLLKVRPRSSYRRQPAQDRDLGFRVTRSIRPCPRAGSPDHGGCYCRGHPRSGQLDRDFNIFRRGHRVRLLVVPGQAGGEEGTHGNDGSRGQAHRNQ